MDTGTDIGQLRNIGEKRRLALNALGIDTLGQLVEYFPWDYEDRSLIIPIGALCPESTHTIHAAVKGSFETRRTGQLSVTQAKAWDDSGEVDLIWFNQPYMKNNLQPGQIYAFTGKVTERLGRMQMESPDYEKVQASGEALHSGRIIPKYTTPGRLSQKVLRGFVKAALDSLTEPLPDFLPDALRNGRRLCSRDAAIRNIHFPMSDEYFLMARRRLVFEELLLMQLALFAIKGRIRREGGLTIAKGDLSRFCDRLPFTLTNAQKKVIEDIQADMSGGLRMNRLIQGDVGSGKTAVAMAAAYGVIQQGYQAVIMAPTEVLAAQHYESFCRMFDPLGIRTVLLSGGMKKAERMNACEALASGQAGMAVGTHALIQQGVVFHNLGLAITDEQHRFGVRQRARLSEKGGAVPPHVLVMTATPIPRTLGLILYGDLDISIIHELPPGRQAIGTYAVSGRYQKRIYALMEKEIAKGRQCYVICPMIEASDQDQQELKSVSTYTDTLREAMPHIRIVGLHGKMKNEEKQAIMSAFAAGETDILVSTTVIEVGVNMPNATVMLIENAERFGLSQLHQLRGRVGRGRDKSYCIMTTDSQSKLTRRRMDAMTSTQDGFKLSELDLELRGPGDYFGTRQHGLPEFSIANLYKDMDILQEAQTLAEELSQSGDLWEKQEYEMLQQAVHQFFGRTEKISL